MYFIHRHGSHAVITLVPFVLLFVAAFFSLPFLGFSLFHIVGRTQAEGVTFCLFFGVLMLWLLLEFVATRERIEIDMDGKTLKRTVSGVFTRKQQAIDLRGIVGIGLEVKRDTRGKRRQYLYLYGTADRYLVNTPAKSYLEHDKLGRALQDITLLPYDAQAGSPPS